MRRAGRSGRIHRFINPIVVDSNGMILAGHGRHAAALELGMTLAPVIVLSEMTEAQKRA
jgi:ParB-like chromosome segregation protein Spo0J